jgi:hypothetical protein
MMDVKGRCVSRSERHKRPLTINRWHGVTTTPMPSLINNHRKEIPYEKR